MKPLLRYRHSVSSVLICAVSVAWSGCVLFEDTSLDFLSQSSVTDAGSDSGGSDADAQVVPTGAFTSATDLETDLAAPGVAPHGLSVTADGIWVGDWATDRLYLLDATGGQITNEVVVDRNLTDFTILNSSVWALDIDDNLVWIDTVGGIITVEQSLSSTDGITYDGSHLCVVRSTTMEHWYTNGTSYEYDKTFRGTPGLLAYDNGFYVTAHAVYGDPCHVEVEVLDGNDPDEHNVVSEFTASVDVCTLTGLAVADAVLYLVGVGGDDELRIHRFTLQ